MPSYEEVIQRAESLRALTGLTDTAFQALLPPVEQAFLVYMDKRTLAGQPRARRRYRPDATCPLPTMADTLRFMLSDLKHKPIPELQGQLCGMSQSKANKWMHLLHPVLNQA